MLSVLLVVLAVATIFQPTAPRMYAALCVVGATVLHDLLLSDLDGLAYYGSAALFDLGAIMLIAGITPVPLMVIRLQSLCLLSILANAAGWVTWSLYLSPVAYDAAFLFLYFFMFLVLVQRSDADGVGGCFTVDSWRSCFRFNRGSWRIYGRQQAGRV